MRNLRDVLVMLMGYTVTEARRGLRSSQGNIDQAIEFIIEVRIASTWLDSNRLLNV